MAGDASCSSSSAAPNSKHEYDVFISFRGEDTRRNFTAHLYAALTSNVIRTYKDNIDLEKGDEVWPALVRAIENSCLCIVVFSKHYASSKWCLKEITHILECKKEMQVLPVFYGISPADVRNHQTGSYGDAIAKHNLKVDEETIKKWKAALEKAGNFSGFDSASEEYRDENHLIRKIVKDVWKKIAYIYPQSKPKVIVGNDKSIADMDILLREFQTIGLWGMGGIGKTTIAKDAFHRHSSQYESHCFLEKVREKSGNLGVGLDGLRKTLLLELLKGENIPVNAKTNLLKNRLRCKTVLIVLDDVDTTKQIEFLVGDINCFGPSSRIIITTRDRHVLNGVVNKIYEVEKLGFQESLQLLSLNAFRQEQPQMGFEKLSQLVVSYAQGLPLALEVLGSHLRFRSSKVWESVLEKLKKYPFKEIENVLKLSYDGLDEEEKEIFLDIAFFFKGEDKKHVKKFLKACNFSATIGLEVLQNKALITISSVGKVEIHDLIQEIGWEIRIAVEGIILDLSTIDDDIHLRGDAFKKMTKLRFLKFYFPILCENQRKSKVCPSGHESFSSSLRYFWWDVYPLESLPSTLSLENLIMLRIQDSPIKILGDGEQEFSNLQEIHLNGCNRLMKFPNFSNAWNLESISLLHFKNLRHVPTFCAERLVKLELNGSRIEKCWDGVLNLANLKEFTVFACMELIELPDLSKASKLEMVNANECLNLCRLHPSLLPLQSLRESGKESQNLNCFQIVALPNNLELIFPKTKDLLLSGTAIKTLPPSIECCTNLQVLALRYSALERLPPCIKDLPSLLFLVISDCKKLRYVPELPPSLIGIYAEGCPSLETVIYPPTLIFCMNVPWRFAYYDFIGMLLTNCLKLDDNSIRAIMMDAYERIKLAATCPCDSPIDGAVSWSEIDYCFPGNKFPWWIKYNECGNWITIELPLRSDLLGFVFCVIFSPEKFPSYKYDDNSFPLITIDCTCYLDDSEIVSSKYVGGFRYDEYSVPLSDHVIMWYWQSHSKAIMEAIRDTTPEHTSYNSKLSFKFFTLVECPDLSWDLSSNNNIKMCGVWPIYASEEMEISLEFSLGSKSNKSDIMDRPTKKSNLSFFTEGSELELGPKSNRYEHIDKLEASTGGIAVGGSAFHHERHGFTEINLNSLLDHERDKKMLLEYQNSTDLMEWALEAYEEQQLPSTKNFKESTVQTIVQMGLELDLYKEAKTHLDTKELEVANTSYESQVSLLQTGEFFSQPHTTPTKVHSDYKDLSGTFSLDSFIEEGDPSSRRKRKRRKSRKKSSTAQHQSNSAGLSANISTPSTQQGDTVVQPGAPIIADTIEEIAQSQGRNSQQQQPPLQLEKTTSSIDPEHSQSMVHMEELNRTLSKSKDTILDKQVLSVALTQENPISGTLQELDLGVDAKIEPRLATLTSGVDEEDPFAKLQSLISADENMSTSSGVNLDEQNKEIADERKITVEQAINDLDAIITDELEAIFGNQEKCEKLVSALQVLKDTDASDQLVSVRLKAFIALLSENLPMMLEKLREASAVEENFQALHRRKEELINFQKTGNQRKLTLAEKCKQCADRINDHEKKTSTLKAKISELQKELQQLESVRPRLEADLERAKKEKQVLLCQAETAVKDFQTTNTQIAHRQSERNAMMEAKAKMVAKWKNFQSIYDSSL